MKIKSLFVLLFLTLSHSLFAETQVPLDSANKYLEFSGQEIRRLHLFPNITNATSCVVYKQTNDTYSLEIYYKQNDKSQRTSGLLSTEEFKNLQSKIDAALATYGLLNQEGRVRFLTFNFFTGFYYGMLTVQTLGWTDTSLGTPTSLTVWATSFAVSFWLTQNADMTLGESDLALFGSYVGLRHGSFLASFISGESSSSIWFNENSDGARLAASLQLAGSIGEMISGYYWAQTQHYGEGESVMLALGTVYGAFVGSWINNLLLPQSLNSSSTDVRISSAVSLTTSVTGTIGFAFLNTLEPYTLGDNAVFTTSIALGSLIGYDLYTWLPFTNQVNSSQSQSAWMLGLSVGGLISGYLLTTGREISENNGKYFSLSALTGSLLGLAVATFIDPDFQEPRILGTSLTVGSLLGFTGGYWAFVLASPQTRSQSKNVWNFEVHPENALAYTILTKFQGNLPFARLEYSF